MDIISQMKIIIYTPGRTKDKSLKAMIDFYRGKLSHYLPVEYVELAEGKGNDMVSVKESEGKAVLDKIRRDDYLVLLDERGKEYTSRQFADYISRSLLSLQTNMVFYLGGPFGFSKDIYDRANDMVALSKMTFTHEMARVLTLEQLYRAMSIIKGEKYHHD